MWALYLLIRLWFAYTGGSARHLASLKYQLLKVVQRLLQPLPGDAAAGADCPADPPAQLAQPQPGLEASRVQGPRQVLLVGEDQDGDGVPLSQLSDLNNRL